MGKMVAMAEATFRFYQELNVFLAPQRRRAAFTVSCARDATAKHMIEALGVPHTEVELILVNGQPAGFERVLAEGDRVAVYPHFNSIDISPLPRLRSPLPQDSIRFVADAHLGGLARLLRMAGFDTLYDNGFRDDELVEIAQREGRIVLSRDIELLKRREVGLGCYLHTIQPDAQLRELAARLGLGRHARPFSLCLRCNVPLRPVDKAQVIDRLPDNVRMHQERFSVCPSCGRVYWEGTHWQAMRRRLADDLGSAILEQSE